MSTGDSRAEDDDRDVDDITLSSEALCLSGGRRPWLLCGTTPPCERARRARRLKNIAKYSREVQIMARKM